MEGMGSRGDGRRRYEDRKRRVFRRRRWRGCVVEEEMGGGECYGRGDGRRRWR